MVGGGCCRVIGLTIGLTAMLSICLNKGGVWGKDGMEEDSVRGKVEIALASAEFVVRHTIIMMPLTSAQAGHTHSLEQAALGLC